MSYFHGTNLSIQTIDLQKCRLRTDFGKGFYLTDTLETAQNWAIRRMELSGGTPTIIRYNVDNELFKSYGKRFSSTPSNEWLQFICLNRRYNNSKLPINEPRHEFNWVSGPIANDKIADVVDSYLAGEISDDEAVRRARALPYTYQLSLHTVEAINFVDNSSVTFKQFKNNKWIPNWRVYGKMECN